MTGRGRESESASGQAMEAGARSRLRLIRIVHTIVWAIFAGSIVAIPVFAHLQQLAVAWALIAFVLLEVLVLAVNGMRCPLTAVAGRYTEDRRDNFDIYLPLWLARYNKHVFGSLYVAGILYTALVATRSLP
jgi:polyferredoxin